jgi:hypothetical protein
MVDAKGILRSPWSSSQRMEDGCGTSRNLRILPGAQPDNQTRFAALGQAAGLAACETLAGEVALARCGSLPGSPAGSRVRLPTLQPACQPVPASSKV